MHSATASQRSKCRRRRARAIAVSAAAFVAMGFAVLGGSVRELRAEVTGQTAAHDPSSIVKDGSTFYYFATGQGIISRNSTNRAAWSNGPSVFGSTWPTWINTAVPGFGGVFWAPDVGYRNNKYYLYYAASTWASQVSAIGVATSPTLNPSAPNYGWTDQGAVIQSTNGSAYNTIDPSIFQDTSTGRMWMAFGSYWNGIYVTELDPTSGKRLSGSPAVNVARNSSIEASALVQHGGFYYLFIDWGTCCSGIDSTYNIRVGRSTSPTGPFLDKNGVNLVNGGGTLFYDDDGHRTGPGHFALYSDGVQDQFGYHYYDGNLDGAPQYGLSNLYWSADNWPGVAPVNPDWTGATDANWSNAANWSGGTIPNGIGSVANFGANAAGRYSVTVDGGGKTLSRINFSSTAGYNIGSAGGGTLTLDAMTGDAQTTINVSAGNHGINAPIAAVDDLGVNVTPATSTLVLGGAVSGKSISKYGHGTLALAGANTYSGNVFVRCGTLDVSGSVAATQYVSVALGTGDEAQLIVRGSGSFVSTVDLNIGDSGDSATPATGTLDLRDNAEVTVNSGGGFYVGSGFFTNTRAVGVVNQTGGTLTASGTFDGAFVVGGRTSNLAVGTYNLAGGVVNANTNVRVGGSGAGTVNQTGGTFNSAGHISIGRLNGAAGVWNISGGSLNQSNAARNLIVGEAGAGTLVVSGTGQVTTAGALRIGASATGSGTVSLNGGVITTPAITRGTGAATLFFNGGTLRAAGSSTTFLQGLTNALVRAGGGTIDTQAFAITVAQPLLHLPALGTSPDGGLTKTGAGTLILAGSNTYTGATTVSAGTLILTTPSQSPVFNSIGGADVRGGRLVFDYTGSPSVASAVYSRLLVSSFSGFTSDQLRSANADAQHGLGWADDPATSRVTVMLTYLGDANLDGTVNGLDFSALATNFGNGGRFWSQGDFNYDGTVNGLDFATLAGNFGLTLSPAATPVPEPAAAGLLVSASLVTARPRRRRRVTERLT